MSLQTDIKWIQSEISQVTDPELINVFKSILKYRNKQENVDWWDTINGEEKEEIETGIKQADKGDFISHEEIKKDFNKWL